MIAFCPPRACSDVLYEPLSRQFHPMPLFFDADQVLVLMLRESQREAVATAIQFEVHNEGLDNALIMYFFAPNLEGEDKEVNGGDLPTKTLLNAVGDLCQTRFVLRMYLTADPTPLQMVFR